MQREKGPLSLKEIWEIVRGMVIKEEKIPKRLEATVLPVLPHKAASGKSCNGNGWVRPDPMSFTDSYDTVNCDACGVRLKRTPEGYASITILK